MSGIALFFITIIGLPVLYKLVTIAPTCHDGIQNQNETMVDRGGPCLLLDPSTLQPYAILWARSFQVRDGSYNSVAYISNANRDAGVARARYEFSLYDSQNILIATKVGETFIMPGGVTPVFVSGLDTGNRLVAHTNFKITDQRLNWERTVASKGLISVSNEETSDINTMPRIAAIVRNTAVADITQPVTFVAVVFDTAGNAYAASETQVDSLTAQGQATIVVTWPSPFVSAVGSIDIIPLRAPAPDPDAHR